MGLFSKPKVPGVNTGALQNIVNKNRQTQIDVLGRKKLALQPLTDKFKTDRTALGAQIQPGAENLITQFGQELQGVGAQEKAANEAASTAQRQQSFRDVPALQRMVRESLGGSGLLRSGGALGQLAAPTLDAARSASDFTNNLTTQQLENEARRSEGLAGTGLNVRSAAPDKKLGFDENTLNTLTNMGRTDLIDEYKALAGIEDTAGEGAFGIEQLRQASEQANAQAGRRGAVLSSLGSLAGMGAGFALGGGPIGAGIGGQLGGALGNFAGGGTGGQIDPTLLFALAQKRSNAQRSLGSGPTQDKFAAAYRSNAYGTR